jgi:hypothetical protein
MQRNPPVAAPGPAGIVPVAAIVPRNGWWSNYPPFGEEQAFPASSNRQLILKADELGPPEVYTLTFGISYSEQEWPGEVRTFDIEAEINFGAGGATQVAKIDWVQGAQVSLVMNAVSVFASYSIDPETAPNRPADLRLSVMVGRGSSPSKAQWTDPTPVDILPLAQTLPRRIAPYSSRIHVIASDFTSTDRVFSAQNLLVFFGGPRASDARVGLVRMDQYLNALGNGIVIPGQAKYASVVNVGDPAEVAQVRLQYEIF